MYVIFPINIYDIVCIYIFYFYIIRLDPSLFLRGAPRAFHSCIRSNNELFISGGMQVHKGKWGTGGDVWSTEGSLNGWKRFVFIPHGKNILISF